MIDPASRHRSRPAVRRVSFHQEHRGRPEDSAACQVSRTWRKTSRRPRSSSARPPDVPGDRRAQRSDGRVRAEPPGLAGTRVRLPNPARDLPPEEAAQLRGAADSGGAAAALPRRRRAHRSGCPAARWRARCSRRWSRRGSRRLGSRRMAGVAANLTAMLDEQYRRQGFERITERTESTLAEAVRLLAREALTARAAAALGAQGRRSVAPLARRQIGKEIAELDRAIARPGHLCPRDPQAAPGSRHGTRRDRRSPTEDNQGQGEEAEGENQDESGEAPAPAPSPRWTARPPKRRGRRRGGWRRRGRRRDDAEAQRRRSGPPGRPGTMPRGRPTRTPSTGPSRAVRRDRRGRRIVRSRRARGCASCSTSSCRICRASSPGSPTGCSAG